MNNLLTQQIDKNYSNELFQPSYTFSNSIYGLIKEKTLLKTDSRYEHCTSQMFYDCVKPETYEYMKAPLPFEVPKDETALIKVCNDTGGVWVPNSKMSTNPYSKTNPNLAYLETTKKYYVNKKIPSEQGGSRMPGAYALNKNTNNLFHSQTNFCAPNGIDSYVPTICGGSITAKNAYMCGTNGLPWESKSNTVNDQIVCVNGDSTGMDITAISITAMNPSGSCVYLKENSNHCTAITSEGSCNEGYIEDGNNKNVQLCEWSAGKCNVSTPQMQCPFPFYRSYLGDDKRENNNRPTIGAQLPLINLNESGSRTGDWIETDVNAIHCQFGAGQTSNGFWHYGAKPSGTWTNNTSSAPPNLQNTSAYSKPAKSTCDGTNCLRIQNKKNGYGLLTVAGSPICQAYNNGTLKIITPPVWEEPRNNGLHSESLSVCMVPKFLDLNPNHCSPQDPPVLQGISTVDNLNITPKTRVLNYPDGKNL